MSSLLLKEIYEMRRESQTEAVEEFLASSKNISAEVEAFSSLLETTDYEKAFAIFCIEVLSRGLKKEHDFTIFASKIFEHMDDTLTYKNSIFFLRTIRTLLNTRFYMPLSYYLTRILGLAISQKNIHSNGKNYTYENIRLSSDDLESEELQIFIASESLGMIRAHCRLFGQSIGFPDFGFVVANELRRCCKIGAFKETVAELIRWLTERIEYVEKERKKLRMENLTGKALAEFESGLEPWSSE